MPLVKKDSRLRTKTSRYQPRESLTPASSRPATNEKNNNNGGFPSKKNSAKAQAPPAGTDYMKGRLAIKAVTMNLSGQSVMGLTPAYKLNYIREYLESLPDVVFIQDGVREEDMTGITEAVAAGKYSCEFQALPRKHKDKEKLEEAALDASVKSLGPPPPQTAIVWNNEKYYGTPLELSDSRLGKLSQWVQHHNLTVVKVGFYDYD